MYINAFHLDLPTQLVIPPPYPRIRLPSPVPGIALAGWTLAAVLAGPLVCDLRASDSDSGRTTRSQGTAGHAEPRTFKTFLPKPGVIADEPPSQVVQLLMDLQDKGGYESYMVQVLFRGKPALEHAHRVYADRVEIDFLDTGKPSMRLARIRGGALEASALDDLYYRDGKAVKRMVRLTLFIHEKPELRFRSTLDRTLIHFRVAKPDGTLPQKGSDTPAPGDSVR